MKKSVVSLLMAAMAAPALPAESSIDRLVGCTDIRDSRDRLACFDHEVAPLASARLRSAPVGSAVDSGVRNPPPSPAPGAHVATPPATPPVVPRRPSFGEEQLSSKDKPEVPKEEQVLHARIERLRTVTASEFLVYLDNGQTWRHEDVVQGEYLHVGDAVTLSKGALGSYRLTRDAGSSKNWIRVSRTK
jgi:hypothetical protein